MKHDIVVIEPCLLYTHLRMPVSSANNILSKVYITVEATCLQVG